MFSNKTEAAAFYEMYPEAEKYSSSRSYEHASIAEHAFHKALEFAKKHGYIPPRNRCPKKVLVDQTKINLINASFGPTYHERQCEFYEGHPGICRVSP